MELMSGRVFLLQFAVILLSTLFYVISFGAGVWWQNTHDAEQQYKLSFTLWRLCTSYGDFDEQCFSIDGDSLESVILTTRVCSSIGLILLSVILVFVLVRFFGLRKTPSTTDDRWLRARSVLLLLLMLFMLLSFAHSHHCPPVYSVGAFHMTSSVGWGWNLFVTAFIFLLFPTCVHLFHEFMVWRSNGKL